MASRGELTDANVIFFGVGIHNVRMGMGCSGWGWDRRGYLL